MRKESILTVFIFFAVLSLILLALWRLNFLNLPSSVISKVFSPVRQAIVLTAVGETDWDKFIDLSKNAEHQRLSRENQALRDQFETSSPSSSDLLPAKIVGYPGIIPNATPSKFLIIDKGEGDGVRKGDAVVFLNSLLGQVTDVNNSSSKVMLISHESFSTTAKLESGSPGVIKGQGESLELSNILLSDEIKKDGLVLTKGNIDDEDFGIPPDLVIGKVVTVEKKSSELFQKAKIQSLVNLEKIGIVFVVVR